MAQYYFPSCKTAAHFMCFYRNTERWEHACACLQRNLSGMLYNLICLTKGDC